MSKKEMRRMAIFLLLALVLTLAAAAIFDRKTACRYALGVNGFYNEPAESVDILGIGSSRMYCTLNPLVLHHDTGLRAYLLSTQQQPLAASYYYLKEALKTQRPQLVILEASLASRPEAETGEAELRDCLDPMRWSENKSAIIRRLVPQNQQSSYYFNFIKYHQRWKELSRKDFSFGWLDDRDPLRGFIFALARQGADCRQWSYDGVEAEPLPPENLQTLRDIAALARENGAELVMLISTNELVEEEQGALKSLHLFCQEEGIRVLDLNLVYDQLALDNAQDYYDEGHLNIFGAIKATRYIGQSLSEDFGLEVSAAPIDAEIAENYDKLIVPFERELEERTA